ncbi:hypothetical protein CYMTET_6689, partial [Cymbomonas tetramitiformis]
MVDSAVFILFPTAMVCASVYTLLSYLMVYYVYIEIYKHSAHKVSYHDYRGYIDHIVESQGRDFAQTLTNSTIHQGHVLLQKFDMMYEDLHDTVVYGLKILAHCFSLIFSMVVGVYDIITIATRGVSSIVTKLLLKLGVRLILEGVSAVGNVMSDFMSAIHQWLVVDGFLDGDPNFLRLFLSLQRSVWVSRELLVEPCGMLRGFWESILAVSSYYPPDGLRVRPDGYYFPAPEALPEYEVFNKWCYAQNLTGTLRNTDRYVEALNTYDPEHTYCAMCDYDGDVRTNCVPYAYNFPIAMNAGLVFFVKTLQMPVHYLLRSRSIANSVSDLASDMMSLRGKRREREEVFDFARHLRTYGTAVAQPEDSRERFFTGDGVEMKYSICWNSYSGYKDSHPDGVPVDAHLHHAPWLLCPSYAEAYRTYDMDGLFTAFVDFVGFSMDAADEWYMSVFNYLQYVLVVDTVGEDLKEVCSELWSVPKATYNSTIDLCRATPPAVFAIPRHTLQAVGGSVRVVGRCVAYVSTILYELRDSWKQLSGDDASGREGLSHQLLETPNTAGCVPRQQAEYPSTTSGEGGDVDSEHYCARNYVIDTGEALLMRLADAVQSLDLDKEADVVRSAVRGVAGNVRFFYRLATVSLFGPFQTPPAPPAYPAPPAPPPFPPPQPKCYMPAVRATNVDDASEVHNGVGLESWQSYGCDYHLDPQDSVTDYVRYRRAVGEASNFTFLYTNKQWMHNEAPTNLTVECFFISVYDAYRRSDLTRGLCPVPEGREDDPDVEMCALSGYPSLSDTENVDTTNLRTSPNVFTFSEENQERCVCDDDQSLPVEERTLHTCPTSQWYAPRRMRLDGSGDTVLSYLVSARASDSRWDASLGYYTREGESEVRYPVCRGLQVTLLDRKGANVSYDFGMRGRCSLSADQYTDGLVSEGYGLQVECSLVAVTDIADDVVRQSATFIVSDEARVMRLPVRVVRRRLNSTVEEPMLSQTVDLLAQGPSWTGRVPEQSFNATWSASVDPAWNAFLSVGGTGAGMHQPLCSCDPFEYVPPTPVRRVRHCAPRVFENVPPPPAPPASPKSPPPPYPLYPPVTNDTVCRNSAGQVMRGFYMRYHSRDVFPEGCVCEFSRLSPVSSYSGNTDDTVYCPEECDDGATADGPTCVCRERDITDFERIANGGREVPHHESAQTSETALEETVRVLNALSVDVASPDAVPAEHDPAVDGEHLEFAYSFDFEEEERRFPTLAELSEANFCANHMGEGWRLHNLNDDDSASNQAFADRLQAVVDSRVNDWTMAATGAAFMDAHCMCADRYRIALPSHARRFYTGETSNDTRREVLGLARQTWRLLAPRDLRGVGNFTADDSSYVDDALSHSLRAASSVASSDTTPSTCAVGDGRLQNMASSATVRALSDAGDGVYRLTDFFVNGTCAADEEVLLTLQGSAYRMVCTARGSDPFAYTAADAHNLRFDWTDSRAREITFASASGAATSSATTYGFMHSIDAEGRVALRNQSGAVSSESGCELPFAFEGEPVFNDLLDSDSRICDMYTDETYLYTGFSSARHPKGRYAFSKALYRRQKMDGDYSTCSASNSSALQTLCHDANLLTAEEMSQAATRCGFSTVVESVAPSRSRSSCRSIPHGFVAQRSVTNEAQIVFFPMNPPSEATGEIEDVSARRLLVDPPNVLNTENTAYMSAAGKRLIAVCSRRASDVQREVLSSTSGDVTTRSDGRPVLTGEPLRLAREAAAEARHEAAKCALNALRTFPYLNADAMDRYRSLYANARKNALERLLPSDLVDRPGAAPWPYPWTRRGRAPNVTRVTIGTVIDLAGGGRGYADLSAVGPVTDRLDVVGRVGAKRFSSVTRSLRGRAGAALGGSRSDPFVYESEVAFSPLRSERLLFGTSTKTPIAQRVFVVERCADDDLAADPLFRVRSLADNRFLKTKGTFPHPNMPSKRSNATQMPFLSRTRHYQADPGLSHERYHTNGSFEALTREEAAVAGDRYEGMDAAVFRSSTVYLVERHDDLYLTSTLVGARRLYDLRGYLFENDVHLSYGVAADTREATDGEEEVVGDFDAASNVGLYGEATRDRHHLPEVRRSDALSIRSRTRPRSYNRQLFTRLDGSVASDAFCTRRNADRDNRTVSETDPHPQDSKLERADCSALDRRTYNNWAVGYPMHGSTVGKQPLEAVYAAGTFDCVALNSLTGSHCAVHGEGGEGCRLGRDVEFAEWVTLPCTQEKPFVCARDTGDYKVVLSPLTFDRAREYCREQFGEDYDLIPPQKDAVDNLNLAILARQSLCNNELLNDYGGSAVPKICDTAATSAVAETHTLSALSNLTAVGGVQARAAPLSGFASCDTTSAYLVLDGTGELVRNEVGRAGESSACPDVTDGSHARGSFYANGDTISLADEAAGGSAWNLQYGDVWIGYRRRVDHEGFSDQRMGVCDPSVANDTLFEIVPCKDDEDSHVPGEFSVLGRDPKGRSTVLAMQQATHPFDEDATGSANALTNAEAFLHAVNRNRTRMQPDSITDARELLDGYTTLFEEEDSEHPLRPSVWTSRASTLKLLESGHRFGLSVGNARAGRCLRSDPDDGAALHNVSLVTCNVERLCGTVQLTVRVGIRTNLALLPVDGESSGEVLQNLFPDLSLQRPLMHSRRTSSRFRARVFEQTANGEELFGWTADANATLSSSERYERDSTLRSTGTEGAFGINVSYGTRGAVDSALEPGDRLRSRAFGGIHASADAANFSGGRGVMHFQTFLHALNETTFPCRSSRVTDASFVYDRCDRVVEEGIAAPAISEVVAPSNCGAVTSRSDSHCTMLAILTGRSLGFVEGTHARPDTFESVRLLRLDTAWNATDDEEIPDFFPDSSDTRHLSVLASRSNRRSLWYQAAQQIRDELQTHTQSDENDILASQGWLYTCAGHTLKFEPASSLENPPAPATPPAPVLTEKQNTNQARFQVSAGGVLTQVSSANEVLQRRGIAEAYVTSNAEHSRLNFQRNSDDRQPYRPHSAYNTYSFTGVEALTATVEYGASERSEETVSACRETEETRCDMYLRDVYQDGSMTDTRARQNMRIVNGASDASDQRPDLDLHYVGGPRLRMPNEYTSGWQEPVENPERDGVPMWIKGYSKNQTGLCGPKDVVYAYELVYDTTRFSVDPWDNQVTWPHAECIEEASLYLEELAESECGHPSRVAIDDVEGYEDDLALNKLGNNYFFETDGFRNRRVCAFEMVRVFGNSISGELTHEQACDIPEGYARCESIHTKYSFRIACKQVVNAIHHYCPASCGHTMWEAPTRYIEGGGKLRLRDAADETNRDGKRLCTCAQTAPDTHCRPVTSNPTSDEYTPLTEEAKKRPEVTFMESFLEQWKSIENPDQVDYNNVMPVVDMWNDAGAHGGSKYDTRFLFRNEGAGWEQDEGNVGPGRILVTFPYNNEHGDDLDHDPADGCNSSSTVMCANARAYSRSDRRHFGMSRERMSDFSNKETFKRVSDLVADLCDDITHAYRRSNDTNGQEFGQPCMGFSAQDMYVYDGAPYDLDDMLSETCLEDDACSEHRYQMMTSHYYPNYQTWRHHRGDNASGWSASRDGLLYALDKTRGDNPAGVYSDYVFQSDHRTSQDGMYDADEFENA